MAALLAATLGAWAPAMAAARAAGGETGPAPSGVCTSRGCSCGRHEAGAKCCCAGKNAPAGPAFSAGCAAGDETPATAPSGGPADRDLPTARLQSSPLWAGERLPADGRPLSPAARPASPPDAVPKPLA